MNIVAGTPHTHKILVLGANGRLGRMVRAVWSNPRFQEIEVIPVSRLGDAEGSGFAWNPDDDSGVFPQVDAVLALWGVIRGDPPVLKQNVVLAEKAIEVAEKTGAQTLLHASSVAVYAFGDDPLSEESELDPVSPYGQSKLEMERIVLNHPTQVRQVLMRIGNVAGTQSLFDNLAKGQSITLDRFSDGTGPVRSFIAPHDLAASVLALAGDDSVSGPVNIAAPGVTAMADLVTAAGCQLEWRDAPTNAIKHVEMDTRLLQSVCRFPDESSQADYLLQSARATGVWP